MTQCKCCRFPTGFTADLPDASLFLEQELRGGESAETGAALLGVDVPQHRLLSRLRFGKSIFLRLEWKKIIRVLSCVFSSQIVAPLLLFMEENDAFWLMSVIIQLLLPPSYFAHGMLGAQASAF